MKDWWCKKQGNKVQYCYTIYTQQSYPEMSGQTSEVINSRFANQRISSRRHVHVWGTSIPSTPDFSQHLPRFLVGSPYFSYLRRRFPRTVLNVSYIEDNPREATS